MKTASHGKNILKVINVRRDTSEAKISKMWTHSKEIKPQECREKRFMKEMNRASVKWEHLQAAKYVAILSSIELRLVRKIIKTIMEQNFQCK